MMIIDRIGC